MVLELLAGLRQRSHGYVGGESNVAECRDQVSIVPLSYVDRVTGLARPVRSEQHDGAASIESLVVSDLDLSVVTHALRSRDA